MFNTFKELFQNLNRRERTATAIVVFNHLMGLAGLNIPAMQLNFEHVSWINLAITFILIIACHRYSTHRISKESEFKKLVQFSVTTFFIGMTVETIGWKTGFPFGSYFYTDVMGPRVLGVPVIIGINWILLSYACAQWMREISSISVRVVAASLLMVMTDFLLEGFAIRHHYWVWETGYPPISNFLGWFATGVLIQSIYNIMLKDTDPAYENKTARFYIPVLLLFLLCDLILSLF